MLCVFVALFFLQHFAHLDSEIGGTNQGEQATSYALAEGFVENNLDFFHPETRALNYRASNYKPEFNSEKERTGITAAHFPIHAYIPALIKKATGGNLLKIVKWYNIFYGFIGLFFLYLLSLRVTNHIGKSLFIVVFIATAPVFSFYQSGIVPEIPSLANAFMGVYFIYLFLIGKSDRKPWVGLLFLLLAAMSTSFFFFVFIAGIVLVLKKYRDRQNLNAKSVILVFSFLVPLIGSEIYFYQMRGVYGSQFPGFLNMWDPEQSVSNDIFSNWKMHYFTVFQSVFILVLIIVGLVQMRKGNLNKQSEKNRYQFLSFCTIGILAALIFYPLQTTTNDLFFLQSLFLPIALVLIVFIDKLNVSILDRFPKLLYPAVLVLLFVLIGEGNWTQTVRHEKNRTSEGNTFVFNFKGSDELLAKHNVSDKVKIGVLVPPHSGTGHQILTELNRKGWIIELPKRDTPIELITEYAVCDSTQMSTLKKLHSFDFELVGSNGTINLIKKKD